MAAASLLDVLAEVPDPRSRHGRVHPLPAILALTVLAMLRGCKGPVAIAQFGRDYGIPLAHALGFTRGKTPGSSCLAELYSRLDAVAFEAALARWVRVRTTPAEASDQRPPQPQEPISLDGKTLRGSKDGDVPGQHLVAAYAPLVEAVLVQVRVDAKTNEHKAALELLGILPVQGRVVIGDAMFCQRDLCATIIAHGGDYLFVVKGNQPGLEVDVGAGFGFEAAAQSIHEATAPLQAAFSPGGGGAAAGPDGPHDGEGAWADRAADAADDEHPDVAAEMAGAGAGP